MLCLISKQIQVAEKINYNWTAIPAEIFTQEALDLFQFIKEKLIEMKIEPHEAAEYLRQLTQKIEEIGFIPPLILNLLRDINGEYQTLIISKNLTPEEEKIIAACLMPAVVGSNEVVPQTSSKDLVRAPREVALPNNASANILGEIYSIVFKNIKNKEYAQKFAAKVSQALSKLTQAPIMAVKNPRPLSIETMLKLNIRPVINPAGIKNYLKELAQQALSRQNGIPVQRNRSNLLN